MKKETIFSSDGIYRYTLWREWQSPTTASGFCMFVCLNPSTADKLENDPTTRRCIGFSKSWGYGALCIMNLFAFRATHRSDLKTFKEPIGIRNTSSLLLDYVNKASLVIAAWGGGGKFNNRGDQVKKILCENGIKLHHLGLNKDGTPKHPLRLAANTKPQPYKL